MKMNEFKEIKVNGNKAFTLDMPPTTGFISLKLKNNVLLYGCLDTTDLRWFNFYGFGADKSNMCISNEEDERFGKIIGDE